MKNEEMREEAQHEENWWQAAALQSALGMNSRLGRETVEKFLPCIAGSK